MSEIKFSVDYSKRASNCKGCKQELPKGDVRLAKITPNPFGGDGDMKQYYHIKCLFETFKRARKTTRKIESADDIEDFQSINDADKKLIKSCIEARGGGKSTITSSNKTNSKSTTSKKPIEIKTDTESSSDDDEGNRDNAKRQNVSRDDDSDDGLKLNENCDDNKFETFQKIVEEIKNESGHLKKTAILKKFFKDGISEKGYKGNKYLFCKLLLPMTSTRVFNMESKQLIKIFSRIFSTDPDDMTDYLNNNGEISQTIRHYFSRSNSSIKPKDKSTLTIKEVDTFLDKLTEITKENDQQKALENFTKKCTKNDLKTLICLIKKDLRTDSGVKIVLDSINTSAYAAFQVSRDLKDVIKRSDDLEKSNTSGKLKKDLSIKINLLTPIKPMLADACKSVEQAFNKCKNGIYAEIKYDGERLQVHKQGGSFKYFSRNLKPVAAHKTDHLKEYVPKCFPKADSLILDGEILLYDTKTKKPLPFGTLGVHKKNKFKDASVCLYVFDCVYLNGKDLMNTSFEDRRKILQDNIKEIPGRIMLSEFTFVQKPPELRKLMMKAINEGLEGLVLKDKKSVYEPGKRHWLKMKKDYLDSGSMADTADLVVLGAYYGTGNKGGMKSIFLMGTLNEKTNTWHTVTKVGNGFDDKTLDKLQKSIDMVETKKNPKSIPNWLKVDSSLMPDFIVKDPKKSPVWEITGAEFSFSKTHTADGISIRFPRVTKVRDDKSWKEATNLERLKDLFKLSKEKSDVMDENDEDENEDEFKSPSPKKKLKRSSDSENETSPKKKKIDDKCIASVHSKNSLNESKQTGILLDLFSAKSFFISKNVEKHQEIKRYIVAYNGETVDESSIAEATHYIVSSQTESISESCPKNVVKMTASNFWECVKSKKYFIK